MVTKLFDTAQLYDTPATANIALVARQMHEVDLSNIAAVVAADFPAGTVVGECIGITISSGGAPGQYVQLGAGSAEMAFKLSQLEDSALWTWNGTTWLLVGKWISPSRTSFTNASLAAGVLTIVHDLGDDSPVVAIWDNTGLLVQQAYGVSLSSYAVQFVDNDTLTITFDPAILPLAGGWLAKVAL